VATLNIFLFGLFTVPRIWSDSIPKPH